MRIRASQAAEAVGGTLVGGDAEFDGASFDTRSLRTGQLFVPLVAERDGHDFIGAAISAGAAVSLWSRPSDTVPALPTIVVGDTAAALMDLAAWARGRSGALVVGVTGSVGKTSTKDLVRAALSADRRVAANERSFNNEQGLPVTILGAPDDTQVLVLEMGMRGFGEIRRLCDVARPDIGIVTAVAPSHTERVGGIEGVARAKAELVEALPDHGTAVLNADDERVRSMAALTDAEVLTFGWSANADVRITDLTLDDLARPRFTIHTPWGNAEVELPISGAHMAGNAAAALTVAGVVGVGLHEAIVALGRTELSAMRMQVDRTAAGGLVINDAYNANPTSMVAALEALAAVDADRRVAVLGMMAELDDPGPAHLAIAARAEALGLRLVAVGTDRYGVDPVDVVDVPGVIGVIGPGTAVLVKASRAIGLDRLATTLTRG